MQEQQIRFTGSQMNRVLPFSSTEFGDREVFEYEYGQLKTKLDGQGADFAYMPEPQRQQAERDVQNLTNSIHVKYFLGELPEIGHHATLDQSIQAGQDCGCWQPGSFPQQALDRFRLDSNLARHEPFAKSDQPRSIQGQGPLAMLLGPGDPRVPGGAAQGRRPHSSRFTTLE